MLILTLIITLAVTIVMVRNPVAAVGLSAIVHVLTAVLSTVLGAESLAVVVVTVHVGAIPVPFSLAIMMLNPRSPEAFSTSITYGPILTSFVIIILASSKFPNYIIRYGTVSETYGVRACAVDSNSHIELMGQLPSNYYGVYIVLAGIVPLLATVASIAIITTRKSYGMVR